MSDKESNLLEKWERNFKKGLLSFWMLMAIAEEPVYAYAMREKIAELSGGSIEADENSIYRALRRFAQNGLVSSRMQASEKGPDRRYFELTVKGESLLGEFIERNLEVFRQKKTVEAMNRISKNGKRN